MKNFTFILVLFFAISSMSHSQNYILAGQSTGTNIHYTDYIPDSNLNLGDNKLQFFLDVDHNGTNDLSFNVWDELYPPCLYGSIWTEVKSLQHNISFITDSVNSNYASSLNSGDTISENENAIFSCDTILTLENYWVWFGSSGYGGNFGNGYLGFKMTFPSETFLGWINMYADDESIIVKESVLSGLTVNIDQSLYDNNQVKIYPNPFNKEIIIDNSHSSKNLIRFEIISMDGKVVKSDNLFNCKSQIDTSTINPEFYILKIIEGDRTHKEAKIIKYNQ